MIKNKLSKLNTKFQRNEKSCFDPTGKVCNKIRGKMLRQKDLCFPFIVFLSLACASVLY